MPHKMSHKDILAAFKETILDSKALEQKNGAFKRLFDKNGIPLENRFAIYRNNVMVSLVQAVTAIYPMLEKLVGEAFLNKAVHDYVRSHLPEHGNLNFYGSTFPDFIADYKPAESLPYLADMARLEWAWEAAYHAKDDSPLKPETLQNLQPQDLPSLRLHLRHSVHLIQSAYPLDEIVDFCRTAQKDEKEQETLDLSRRGAELMVFRPDLKVQLRKLSKSEYVFLKALQSGHPLSDAAEETLLEDENFNLADILQKHITLGTCTDVIQPEVKTETTKTGEQGKTAP